MKVAWIAREGNGTSSFYLGPGCIQVPWLTGGSVDSAERSDRKSLQGVESKLMLRVVVNSAGGSKRGLRN
jgi:hypothetical protein